MTSGSADGLCSTDQACPESVSITSRPVDVSISFLGHTITYDLADPDTVDLQHETDGHGNGFLYFTSNVQPRSKTGLTHGVVFVGGRRTLWTASDSVCASESGDQPQQRDLKISIDYSKEPSAGLNMRMTGETPHAIAHATQTQLQTSGSLFTPANAIFIIPSDEASGHGSGLMLEEGDSQIPNKEHSAGDSLIWTATSTSRIEAVLHAPQSSSSRTSPNPKQPYSTIALSFAGSRGTERVWACSH